MILDIPEISNLPGYISTLVVKRQTPRSTRDAHLIATHARLLRCITALNQLRAKPPSRPVKRHPTYANVLPAHMTPAPVDVVSDLRGAL